MLLKVLFRQSKSVLKQNKTNQPNPKQIKNHTQTPTKQENPQTKKQQQNPQRFKNLSLNLIDMPWVYVQILELLSAGKNYDCYS